jgi:hypothetical protein
MASATPGEASAAERAARPGDPYERRGPA